MSREEIKNKIKSYVENNMEDWEVWFSDEEFFCDLVRPQIRFVRITTRKIMFEEEFVIHSDNEIWHEEKILQESYHDMSSLPKELMELVKKWQEGENNNEK